MLSDTNQIRCVIDTFVQHYVIKFVNDLRQVIGFPRVVKKKQI
jgi:hypothetical protein